MGESGRDGACQVSGVVDIGGMVDCCCLALRGLESWDLEAGVWFGDGVRGGDDWVRSFICLDGFVWACLDYGAQGLDRVHLYLRCMIIDQCDMEI